MITDAGGLEVLKGLRAWFTGLPALSGLTPVFVLFKADFGPDRSLVWADVAAIEADFVGYLRPNVMASFVNVPAISGGNPRVQADPVVFEKTAGAPIQEIYGYGVVYVDGTDTVQLLFNARKFTVPKMLTDGSPEVEFTPYFGDIPV